MKKGQIGLLVLGLLGACGDGEGATGEAFDPEVTTTAAGGTDNETGESNGSTSGVTSADPTTSTAPVTTLGDGSSSTSTTSDDGDSSSASTGITDDCPRIRIVVGAGLTLNVRPDPSTNNPPVGSLVDGALVDVIGEAIGQEIEGEDLWYEIDSGAVQGYVLSTFAMCTQEQPPDIDPNGWYLPLPCGVSAQMTQGNNSAFSHNGLSAYAFDFGLPLGSSLVAIADGVVTHAYNETGPGDPCYNGGGMECANEANFVTLLHADGTKSVYLHLQTTSVSVGDTVPIGTEIGLTGSTGWSTGRHAHIMRMEDCGGSYCQSIPLAFNDVAGDGVPLSGDQVTSGNCP